MIQQETIDQIDMEVELQISKCEQRIKDMERMLGLAVIGGNASFRETLEYLLIMEQDWLTSLRQPLQDSYDNGEADVPEDISNEEKDAEMPQTLDLGNGLMATKIS